MTEISASSYLADAIRDLWRDDIPTLWQTAGITSRAAARAAKGFPISAAAFMRICCVIGFDPIERRRTDPRWPGRFEQHALACAIRMRRMALDLNQRNAAKVIGISSATISRIEQALPASIDTTLKSCRFVDVHPFNYLIPEPGADVSRGYSDCSKLTNNNNSEQSQCI